MKLLFREKAGSDMKQLFEAHTLFQLATFLCSKLPPFYYNNLPGKKQVPIRLISFIKADRVFTEAVKSSFVLF